jgi:hypothetical protein
MGADVLLTTTQKAMSFCSATKEMPPRMECY